jgi:NTP pyrophosphatase (non-canonical NTP hydrolase)
MNPFDLEFLETCREITRAYEETSGRWSYQDQLNHIHDEVSEVSDVIRNKNEKYGKISSFEYKKKLFEEVADIVLTTLTLKDIIGITDQEMNESLITKLQILILRLETGKR